MSKKKKVIIIIVSVFLAIVLIASLGKGKNNKKNNGPINAPVVTETETPSIDDGDAPVENEDDESEEDGIVDANGYVIPESEGYIKLANYGLLSSILDPCYDKQGDEVGFILVWKNADKAIPKIKKSSLVGITDTYTEIKVIPIGDNEPQYMVPINFGNDPVDDVADFPETITGHNLYSGSEYNDNVDFQLPEKLLSPGNPLTECNGEDLKEFVDKNCDTFVWPIDQWNVGYDKYKVIKGNKDQEYTFGGYVGTEWKEFKSKACIEYYKLYAKEKDDKLSKHISVEKTKEGYFKVDLSKLDNGIYYVDEYSTFIEITD